MHNREQGLCYRAKVFEHFCKTNFFEGRGNLTLVYVQNASEANVGNSNLFWLADSEYGC